MRKTKSNRKVSPKKLLRRSRVARGVHDTLGHSRPIILCGSVFIASIVNVLSPVRAASAFPAVFEVSTLNGQNGFTINGTAAGDMSGLAVSNAGDVNNDGIDDLIIGAPGADVSGRFLAGQSYVVFGSKDPFPRTIGLANLNGHNGFSIYGPGSGSSGSTGSGNAVATAGDVNGDGIDDLLVGAAWADPFGTQDTGQTFVVFGRNGDFESVVDLSSLNGDNGFAINGFNNVTEYSGFSVSGAGDINGDGINDIVIGAPGSFSDFGGRAYVVFGRDTKATGNFPPALNASALNGHDGFTVNSVARQNRLGISVAAAGDVNNDGIGDLLIGADLADPYALNAGETYIIFGRDTASNGDFDSVFELSGLNGLNGFKASGGYLAEQSGKSVSSAGDINGDGIDDIIIGSPSFPGVVSGSYANSRYGRSYIVFGRNTAVDGRFPATVPLTNLDGKNGFAIVGINTDDFLGSSVSGVGDVNGDGIDDLIVGAGGADPGGKSNAGQAYVLFGKDTSKTGNFPPVVPASGFSGLNGFTINGRNAGDTLGGLSSLQVGGSLGNRQVSAAGDINGDGVADLLIGASGADPNGESSGASYVVFGQKSEAFAKPLVRCPGDVNGDGIADIAVVTPDGHTWIKGLNGSLVSHFTPTAIHTVVDVEVMPDTNANGSPEWVALGTGSVKAEVWDTLTAAQLSLVNFDPAFTPVDLELVADQTGNGIPELATLGQGSVQVEVKDGLTGAVVNTVSFSNDFNARDLEIYPDLNGNSAPELAVLGDNKDPSKGDKLEVRDLTTGGPVQNIWLGKNWQVLQQALIADLNGNGSKEVAVLRVKNDSDAVNVMFRDTKTRQGLGSIGFDRNYPPIKLLTLGDVNGNGADEVVVFGQRFNGGNQKAQIKDSKTHALVEAVFFDKNFAGQDIATCGDINGNGAEELVMLGKRASDGKLRAIVKDAKTGEPIGAVDF